MKFSQDSILRRCRKKTNPLPYLEDWIAEIPSWLPDGQQSWPFNFQYKGALEAISVFFLSLFCHYWQTDFLHKRMSEDCFRHNYQGRWLQLQELLENVTNIQEFYNYAESSLNPYEFYGNILPKANRIALILKENKNCNRGFQNPEKKKKPKRLIRHRGYRDKGSLRPLQDHHGEDISDTKNDDREDRRSFLAHPLLRSDGPKNENDGLGNVEEPHSQKGGTD